MQRLHLEVLKIEFNQYEVDSEESIAMRDFAESIVAAEPPHFFKDRLEKIGTKEYTDRVTFQQFYDFNQSRLHVLIG
jgi:hypothetical protein